MEINYPLILGLTILAMVVGAIWYGPLFGRKWMGLIGVNPDDAEAVKVMQKGMAPIYLTQLALTFIQLWVLAHYVKGAIDEMSGLSNTLWIWAGIVVPTLASAGLWSNEPKKQAWTRFLIQAGYLLVMFLIYGYALGEWG